MDRDIKPFFNNHNNNNEVNSMKLMLQYNKGPSCIIIRIVHEQAVYGAAAPLARHSKVLLLDGEMQRLATVLEAYQREEFMLTALRQLKALCFEEIFDDDDNETTIQGDPWLLVQYSCSHSHLVYAVLRFSETIGRDANEYNDVVAYLSDGDAIYRAIILRKAHTRSDLDGALRRIVELCGTSQEVPLENAALEGAVGPVIPQPCDTEDICRLEKQILELEQMERRMQYEARSIYGAFTSVDQLRRSLEDRLSMLDGL